MSNQITPNPSVPSQVVQKVKFPQFVNNLGIIPTSYKDSMSYYETLAWLCKYLEETIIPTVNENGEAVEELQGLYIELNSYVTHYFDTLDVQEEINNKLDEMAKDGSLYEIIERFLDPIIEEQNSQLISMNSQLSNFQRQLNSVASGSPAGVYDTYQDLVAANPNHSKIYLVASNGHWYYYDETWTDGGTYQATEIANESLTKDQMNYFKNTSNLFNKNTAKIGKYIGYNDGNEYNATQPGVYYATDFIEIPNGCKVITHSLTNGINMYAFYDSSKTYISGSNKPTLSLMVPDNAKYIRLTVKESVENFVVSAGGSYTLFDYLSLNDNDIKYIKQFMLSKSINPNCLVDKSKVLEGYFEGGNPTSGTNITRIIDSGDYYGETDFIPLEYGETIYANKNFSFRTEYDEDFNLIKTDNVPPSPSFTPLNEDCKYIRLLLQRSTFNEITFSKTQSDVSHYIPQYTPDIEKNSITKDMLATDVINYIDQNKIYGFLTNKKITFLGDSITYGYDGSDPGSRVQNPYPKIIQELTECVATNSGINGTTISGTGNQIDNIYDGYMPVNVRIQNVNSNQDILVIFAGTNDWAGHREIGTITDQTNATFYGALNIILNYYYNNFVQNGMKLLFVTPIQRSNGYGPNSAGYKLIDYVNAIKNICNQFSIPVLDLYNSGNIYAYNSNYRSAYLPDGLHPNQDLYNLLANRIGKFLNYNI